MLVINHDVLDGNTFHDPNGKGHRNVCKAGRDEIWGRRCQNHRQCDSGTVLNLFEKGPLN